MNIVRDFISKLDRQDVLRMIEDWEQIERDGRIGDCLLRSNAHALMEKITKGTLPGSILIWTEKLTFESYRRIANEVKEAKP
jgi:hypothetical protein